MEHGPFKWVKPGAFVLPEIRVNKPDEIINESFMSYLSDKSCMSSSYMKTILKSPRHYIAALAGYDVDDEDEKDHFRLGRAVHMSILEPKIFKELYVVMPDLGPMQSPKNRAKRDEWVAQQRSDALILKQDELDHLHYMIDALMAHPEANDLLRQGTPETSGRFTHKETGIRCKIRPDYFTWKGNDLFLSDIKTTRDAGHGLFATDTARLKYHMQLAFYHDGFTQITGHKPSGTALIAMEKKLPYTVAVYWLDEDDLALGTQWYKFALMTLQKCLDLNQWPGTQLHGEILRLPRWTKDETFPQFDWREK